MAAPPSPAIRDAAGLAAFLGETPALRDPLAAVAALALPDAWIGAGFVRNALCDALHGLPFGANPPGDVDVVWFDPAHASAEEDAAMEARLRAAMPDAPWSVRNQARMAERHGDPPYAGTVHAMSRWCATTDAVGARLGASGVEIAAPWGLDDLFGLVLRPTPAAMADPARRAAFDRRIAEKGWLRRWPALRIVDDPPPGRAA